MPNTRFPAKLLDTIHHDKIIGLRVGKEKHRFLGLWAVVTGNRVFIRSWSVKPDGWFHRARREPFGVLAIGNRRIRVRLVRTRSETIKSAVDAAYAEKYRTPGAVQYVRDLRKAKSRDATIELAPLV